MLSFSSCSRAHLTTHLPTALRAKLERQKALADPSGRAGKDGCLLAARRGQGTPSLSLAGTHRRAQCCCSLAQPHGEW